MLRPLISLYGSYFTLDCTIRCFVLGLSCCYCIVCYWKVIQLRLLKNMNHLRMSQERTGKSHSCSGVTETVVRNRCWYQVPEIVGTNASTNENHKFYNSKVQAISRGGVYCAIEVGALCIHFLSRIPGKNQGGKWSLQALRFTGSYRWCVWPIHFNLNISGS